MEKRHLEVIFCAGGNKRLADIALEAGFLFGSQLPLTNYHQIYFADQDWKSPKKEQYLREVEKYKPKIATVLDLEFASQFDDVIDWCEKVSHFVETIIVIPKMNGIIKNLPRYINNKKIRLGYSVPTKFGGTSVPIEEFYGWDVHLLGGSPHKQIKLFSQMNVVSVDGNMSAKMATRFCAFWCNGSAIYAKDRFWPKLKESDGNTFGKDAPYEAFRRSCTNIMAAWKEIAFVNSAK